MAERVLPLVTEEILQNFLAEVRQILREDGDRAQLIIGWIVLLEADNPVLLERMKEVVKKYPYPDELLIDLYELYSLLRYAGEENPKVLH